MRDVSKLLRGTPGSIRVCEFISQRSGGVCLFGFSRGKDSLGAWLWLRKFFSRIIPFHCASVPHLSFVDAALDYYEKQFNTKIERCLSGDIQFLIQQLCFQPIGDEKAIEKLKLKRYGNNEVAAALKVKYKLPESTYTAYGISMHDSLFRRVRMQKAGSKEIPGFGVIDNAAYRESTYTFLPCYDWKTADILHAVELAGLRLPDDYKMANRTIANGIDTKHLERLPHLFPQDMRRIEAMFPFIRVYEARNEFRRRRIAREQGAA